VIAISEYIDSHYGFKLEQQIPLSVHLTIMPPHFDIKEVFICRSFVLVLDVMGFPFANIVEID
jgi:hypothetical protein